jgi:hypothetical protein
MSQGRIKRLQPEARLASQPFKPAERVVCALGERSMPPALRDAHHLIPKSRGGVATALVRRARHKRVHALFTTMDAAQHQPHDQLN